VVLIYHSARTILYGAFSEQAHNSQKRLIVGGKMQNPTPSESRPPGDVFRESGDLLLLPGAVNPSG